MIAQCGKNVIYIYFLKLEERLYRKFTWLKQNTKDLIDQLEKKKDKECKNKQVYCFCEPLHYDQIINGLCCDNKAQCDCCKTDPTIKKRPKLVADPVPGPSCQEQKTNSVFTNEERKRLFCVWSEGWERSNCCEKNYQLVSMDERYFEKKIPIGKQPHSAIEGIVRHHPFCRNNRPWIHPLVCSMEWYYVLNPY
ncbi:hypothetical protein niasHT_021895 [Heterodera trifolii]|uniref:Uncharacterized protein n=1 Tax=Heterodera trifolii TaxID=157864 RepID=A0ABD2K910_9BILA